METATEVGTPGEPADPKLDHDVGLDFESCRNTTQMILRNTMDVGSGTEIKEMKKRVESFLASNYRGYGHTIV